MIYFGGFVHSRWLFHSSAMSDAEHTAHQTVGGYNRQLLSRIKLLQVGKIWSYYLDLISYFSTSKLIFNCLFSALKKYDTTKTCRWNFFKDSWVVHYRKVSKNQIWKQGLPCYFCSSRDQQIKNNPIIK